MRLTTTPLLRAIVPKAFQQEIAVFGLVIESDISCRFSRNCRETSICQSSDNFCNLDIPVKTSSPGLYKLDFADRAFSIGNGCWFLLVKDAERIIVCFWASHCKLRPISNLWLTGVTLDLDHSAWFPNGNVCFVLTSALCYISSTRSVLFVGTFTSRILLSESKK